MSEGILAGVGKADITCPAEGVWEDVLSEKVKAHIPPDYLKKRIEVSDPVYARALVLDDGREKVVLVTMDVTAIGARTISQNILSDSADDFMPNLRERVERELGIPGRNVTVCASHTHQVPRILCDDDAQVDRTVGAIKHALQNMVPVAVGVGSGKYEARAVTARETRTIIPIPITVSFNLIYNQRYSLLQRNLNRYFYVITIYSLLSGCCRADLT